MSAKTLAFLFIATASCADEADEEDNCTFNSRALREDGTCIPGCDAVVTLENEPSDFCARSGVAIGCVPEFESDFWESHINPQEIFGFCVQPWSEPDVLYCLGGWHQLWWFHNHPEFWCGENDIRCNVPVKKICSE